MANLQFTNNFRGIAILLIILAHSLSVVNSYDDKNYITNILSLLLSNSTIFFIVLAGYFFSALSQNFNYLSFLKNKFNFVILPYIFISIPAICLYVFHLKDSHF